MSGDTFCVLIKTSHLKVAPPKSCCAAIMTAVGRAVLGRDEQRTLGENAKNVISRQGHSGYKDFSIAQLKHGWAAAL